MKITIVQGAFLPVPPLRGGAVEKVWFSMGQEFARRGHEVTHISRSFPDLPDREVIENVRHIRVAGYDTPRSLALLKMCDLAYSMRVLRRLPAADILVTNTFWLPILVRSSRFGKVCVHVARFPKGQMRFYSHVARLQAISRSIEEAIVEESPRCRSLIECLPLPLSEKNAAARATIVEGRAKQMLYVGRVHPEKGLDMLISALARLSRDQLGDWKLLVVGPSETSDGGGGAEYLAALKRLAEPVKDRIEWIGPVYDPGQLARYYETASLFLYPSLAERGEAFGLAPLEAMSYGCPALVSDLGCFRDFVTDEVNGFVFDHRAPEPDRVLAEAIAGLIRDEAKLEGARVAALSTAKEFTVERVAGLYLEDFQTLAAA